MTRIWSKEQQEERDAEIQYLFVQLQQHIRTLAIGDRENETQDRRMMGESNACFVQLQQHVRALLRRIEELEQERKELIADYERRLRELERLKG